MLLVAQRVQGLMTQGINLFAYVHGHSASAFLARDPMLAFDPAVATRFPPSLVVTMYSVKEGGASVLSFLDVAFPDTLPARSAASLLEQAALRGRAGEPDSSWSVGPLAVRFHSLASIDAAAEFGNLKGALLPVLGHTIPQLTRQPPFPVRPTGPVKILRARGGAGSRYEIEPNDRATLTSLLGRLPASSFSIADETFDAFRAFSQFSLSRVVVEALTGATLEQIKQFGGALIANAQTGAVEWDSRIPDSDAP